LWLLLCHAHDRSALWAARGLRARGIEPLRVLTPELLHYSRRWEHRLQADGRTSVAFTLADGTEIDGQEVCGVVNRIPAVPLHLLTHLVESDRAYAQQEWTAFHMSWLASLPAPVLNLPVAEGLCGAWRHPSEWAWLAAQAGLDAGEYVQSSAVPRQAARAMSSVQTVIAVDGQGVGEVTDDVGDACGRLAALATTRILGVDLDLRSGRFVTASPLPDLRAGGERVLDVLARALRARTA
jgi:hypothetical protein